MHHQPLKLATHRPDCAQCLTREPCAMNAYCRTKATPELVPASEIIRPRQALFLQGSPTHYAAVVRSGSLKCVYDSADGREQIVAFALPGDLIDPASLAGAAHDVSAFALETTAICKLPVEELWANTDALRALHRAAAKRCTDRDEHLMVVAQQPARVRLAWFVHKLAAHYARRGLRDSEFVLSMSRQDIANYLALAIETVSRIFGDLSRAGVLEVRDRMIRIVDPEQLAKLASVEGSLTHEHCAIG